MTKAAESRRKRGAERQITKDDRDDESGSEDDPVREGFRKAEDAILAQRRIVKVARTAEGGVDFSKKKVNPFAGVTLTAATKPDNDDDKVENSTDAADKPKVFGAATGFSGFATLGESKGFGFATAAGFGEAFKTADPNAFGGAAATFAFAKTADEGSNTTTALVKKEDAKTILPSDYELKSGEEDETLVLEKRCKTYRSGTAEAAKSPTSTTAEAAVPSVPPSESSLGATAVEKKEDKPGAKEENGSEKPAGEDDKNKTREKTWLEIGTGPLRLLRHQQGRLRAVQRRETTPGGSATKVILNVPLYRESAVSKLSDKHVQIVTVSEGAATTILCKFKTAMEASEVFGALEREIRTAPQVWKGKKETVEESKDA